MEVTCNGKRVELKVVKKAGVVGSMSKQIMAEIYKSKKCPLAEFVGSLATKFMGRRQAEIMIEGGIDSLEKFVTLTSPDQLAGIPGFSLEGSKATELIKGLIKARPTMKALLDVGVEVVEPGQEEQVAVAAEGATLAGMAVCFTGVRPKSDEELRFRSLGGVIKDGVSKNCTHLVVRDPSTTSNKATKARELGLKIIGYEEFQNLLK